MGFQSGVTGGSRLARFSYSQSAGESFQFSITQVPSVVGWYQFSDTSTLWQDTSRTTPVTADGQVIAGVTDKSTAANHLAAASTREPLYKVNIQNSLGAALFDGTNDFIEKATVSYAQPNMFFLVVKRAAAGSQVFVDGTAANRNLVWWDGQQKYFSGTGTLQGLASDTNFHIVAVRFATTSSALFQDGGAATASGSGGTHSMAAFRFGGSAVPDQFLNGYIAEAVMIDAVPSVAHQNAIGDDLADRWNLTWNAVS